MKFFLLLLVIVSLSIIPTGCQNDDSIGNTELLLTITVKPGYVPWTGDFFFITSYDGELLGSAEVTGSSVNIYGPEGSSSDQFILHRFFTNGSYYNLTSRLALSPREIFLTESPFEFLGRRLGTADIHFDDIPEHDGFYTSGWNMSNQLISANIIPRVNVFESHNQSYLFLKNGDLGSYKMLENLQVGENRISLTSLATEIEQFTIDMKGEVVNSANIRAAKPFSFATLSLYHNAYYPDLSPDDSNLDFFLPSELPSEYERLLTNISTESDEFTYAMNVTGTIPTAYEKINASIINVDSDLSSLTMQLNGDGFDYVWRYATGFSRNDNELLTMDWHVYSPSDQQVNFPSLPVTITNRFPEFSLEGLMDLESIGNYYRIVDNDGMNGYSDYINGIYPEDPSSIENNTQLSVSTAIESDDSGGRFTQNHEDEFYNPFGDNDHLRNR